MSFLIDTEIVAQALQAYHQQSESGEGPVIDQPRMEELISDMGLAAQIRTGGLAGEKLAQFVDKYLASTTRLHHPGYLAHQLAVPHYAGALAAFIEGYADNVTSIYEMGPGATSIEYFIINWLLDKVGWQPAPVHPVPDMSERIYGGGVLTHGGSLANLTALIMARSRIAPQTWQDGTPGDLALLAPEECHYSIARAAGILGIGQSAIYHLAVDGGGVIVPDKLPIALHRLENQGKRAMALIANACSTAVGLYDPLQEIGEFCQAHKLWFHVDGAHGASALLSDKYRYRLNGIDKADTLSWDAHKLLRTPALCTALLARDHRDLDGAFQQEASYLFHDKERPGFDFIQRTIECTKPDLGLRLFMALAALGERGMALFIERQFDLAAEAYEYIKQLPDFECAVAPQANILCFRVSGNDELQLQVRDKLIAEGDFYLSSATLNGKRYLRIVLMSPATTMDHITRLVGKIRRIVETREEYRQVA